MARRTNDELNYSLVRYCINLPDLNGCSSSSNNAGTTANAPPSSVHSSVADVCVEFKRKNVTTFDDMFHSLEMSDKNAQSCYLGVINELFAEGITWPRMMAFLTFSALFASRCVDKRIHSSTDTVAEWTVTYVQQHLSTWIDDHGGWDALSGSFNTETINGSNSFKRLFWGAAGAVGAVTLGAFLASRS